MVVSLAITSVFYVKMTRQQAAAKPKTVKVMAATAELQPATPITAEQVKEIDWPASISPDGMVQKKEDVVGRVLLYPISAGQPLAKNAIASPSTFGLAANIPDGMRAVAVRTNEVSNLAGLLVPGARVDVLVTLRGDNNTMSTRTVLQNIRVLSTGAKLVADPQAKPENVAIATLLVSPDEAEKLALAQQQGNIQLVLRNGGDSQQLASTPVDLASLGAAKTAPAAEKPVRKIIAKLKSPAYSVETIAGNKSTVSKFETTAQ